MRAKSYHNYPMPSADLVLDLIYSAPETDNKFLSFTSLTYAKRPLNTYMRTMDAAAAPV